MIPLSISQIVNKFWGAGTRTITSVPSVIQSIQYSAITMSGTSTSTTITAVAPTKAFISYLGSDHQGGGTPASYGNVKVTLTNSTSVTATRTGTSSASIVQFCVVEFA